MAEKLIFDNETELNAYRALALEAYKTARLSECKNCKGSGCAKCAAWADDTIEWDIGSQRLTDSKYICTPCSDMDNSAYTIVEDDESWYNEVSIDE